MDRHTGSPSLLSPGAFSFVTYPGILTSLRRRYDTSIGLDAANTESVRLIPCTAPLALDQLTSSFTSSGKFERRGNYAKAGVEEKHSAEKGITQAQARWGLCPHFTVSRFPVPKGNCSLSIECDGADRFLPVDKRDAYPTTISHNIKACQYHADSESYRGRTRALVICLRSLSCGQLGLHSLWWDSDTDICVALVMYPL